MEESVEAIQMESEQRVSLAVNGGPPPPRLSKSPTASSSSRRESKAAAGGSNAVARPAESGMTFENVCVDADGKRLLWDVSGRAVAGQMLAVMGPSGESY